VNARLFDELRACLARRELVAVATVLEGPGIGNQLLIWPGEQVLGDLGSPRLNQRAALFAEKAFQDFGGKRKALRTDEGRVEVFFDVYPPPPKLILVGAVHVAIRLIDLARQLGFYTVVIDPRTAFATAERFAAADELHQAWPQEVLPTIGLDAGTYLAALSHDLKIDLPALVLALGSPARYVGALGSPRTHEKRVAALREAGLSEPQIARIRAPIGLDLGGRRAEEIALSILAEMVAASHGRLSVPS
jgi:xanthine dehydrogenase accessory factor